MTSTTRPGNGRERPLDRFQPQALRPLPITPYDYRDSSDALVHKDLRLPFDGNRYCVPHRYVGRRLTIKADSSSVTIYDRVQEVVSYPRSWRRAQTFGAERFEKLLAEERPAARRSQQRRQTLPRDRIGPAGHQARQVLHGSRTC
jgi:hypothetical protein